MSVEHWICLQYSELKELLLIIPPQFFIGGCIRGFSRQDVLGEEVNPSGMEVYNTSSLFSANSS